MNDSEEDDIQRSDTKDELPTIRSELWEHEKLEVLRNISSERITSRKGSIRETRESLLDTYSQLPPAELLELAVSSEIHALDLEDENFALLEQINLCQRDISALQSDVTRVKRSLTDKLDDMRGERDKYKQLASSRESEVIFLEDHARFSAEQTKLSITHWDLLLKNRDENIELLTARVASLSKSNGTNISIDAYRCLEERVKSLSNECRTLREQLGITSSPTDMDSAECPWRHQADVRVAQLERLTCQLNATYSQLHSKSDELLLQNRELGNLRRKSFECEAKLKKYRAKVAALRERLSGPSPSVPTTESSSIQSSD